MSRTADLAPWSLSRAMSGRNARLADLLRGYGLSVPARGMSSCAAIVPRNWL